MPWRSESTSPAPAGQAADMEKFPGDAAAATEQDVRSVADANLAMVAHIAHYICRGFRESAADPKFKAIYLKHSFSFFFLAQALSSIYRRKKRDIHSYHIPTIHPGR